MRACDSFSRHRSADCIYTTSRSGKERIDGLQVTEQLEANCGGSIHASAGFHLWILPHAGQRNGTATGGSDLNTTHSAFRPVETGLFVTGQLITISAEYDPQCPSRERRAGGCRGRDRFRTRSNASGIGELPRPIKLRWLAQPAVEDRFLQRRPRWHRRSHTQRGCPLPLQARKSRYPQFPQGD
jgi:hypothetical protein